MQDYYSIKNWAEDDRPREKLAQKGTRMLSNAELLAIILGSGSRNKTAVELAQELLYSSNNDLLRFSALTLEELKRFKGVGDAKAIGVIAAMELGRRRAATSEKNQKKIRQSMDIYKFMKPYMLNLMHEEFHIILIDRSNTMIAHKQISMGGRAATTADGKIMFKYALDFSAQGMILVHNHPSGNPQPSEQDKRLTASLVEFGRFVDLPIVDHIIFTDNNYFSFSDCRML
jgi:DNA repair protein RadC